MRAWGKGLVVSGAGRGGGAGEAHLDSSRVSGIGVEEGQQSGLYDSLGCYLPRLSRNYVTLFLL